MSGSGLVFRARTLAPGSAWGPLLRLSEPLSFWGGFDAVTGRITDRRHPQAGRCLTGQVALMPAGRGSGSSSSVLAEAIRRGTAPAAILLREPDLILTIGATVAAELYGRACPVVVLEPADYDALPAGAEVEVQAADESATLRTATELPQPAPAPTETGGRGAGGSGAGLPCHGRCPSST